MKGKFVRISLFIGIVFLFMVGLFFTNPYKNMANKKTDDVTEKNSRKWKNVKAELKDITYKDHDLCNLEVFSCDLEPKVRITSNWLQLPFDITEKYQDILFKTRVVYRVDLNGDLNDTFSIDDKKKCIFIRIKKPRYDKVDFDPTEYQLSRKNGGLLSFGEIKLTPDQYLELEKCAYDATRKEVEKQKAQKKANESAKKAVKKIYKEKIEKSYPDYSIKVELR